MGDVQGHRKLFAAAAVAALGSVVLSISIFRKRAGATAGAESTRPVSQNTRLARNTRVAAIGAKAGSGYALHRARRIFANAERRDELDSRFEIKTAAQVTEALGQMKGAMMKLGQMASYLDQGLPPHIREALTSLQHDAPPMSGDLAAEMIRGELGERPEILFAEWDPVPIAAASIGQVHRAITREGDAVAVKVQYPGVDEAVGADLGNIGLVFAGLGQLFPGLDHRSVVTELKTRLAEELDYELEASNQRLFADAYAGHPFIHVPAVIDRYSTRRVLTTELADGARWDEMLTWGQDQRDLAAETIYRFAFGGIYQLRIFNGDPHPGNYLFKPGGNVTFLDYGLVKRFTADELHGFQDMIIAMVFNRDPSEFRGVVERLGLIKPGMAFTDEEVEDYFGHFYEFVMDDGVSEITPEYASETIRRFFDMTGPYAEIMKAANVPTSMVVLQRINLGLYALFGELHARGNWRSLAEEIWPFVAGAPSTPMGETIARWESERGTIVNEF